MTHQEALKLLSGDMVTWIDPDAGACSKVIKIRSVEVIDDMFCIVGEHDQHVFVLKCPPRELTRKVLLKVRLARVTRDYVEILVYEDDVGTAAEAEDFVNNQLGDPDWDPVEHAIEGSEWADVNQPWEVLDVELADPPQGTST